MPLNMAVSAVSTLGYLEILMGPAIIGFIAHKTSLYTSFGLLAGLVVLQMCVAAYIYISIMSIILDIYEMPLVLVVTIKD